MPVSDDDRRAAAEESLALALAPIHDAIAAADQFLRWARYHLDRPQPERLEQEGIKLMQAMEKMNAP